MGLGVGAGEAFEVRWCVTEVMVVMVVYTQGKKRAGGKTGLTPSFFIV